MPYRQPEGSFVVGLEGIDIQSGTDYFRYVVPGARIRMSLRTSAHGWVVVVWCRAFAVPVEHAAA